MHLMQVCPTFLVFANEHITARAT